MTFQHAVSRTLIQAGLVLCLFLAATTAQSQEQGAPQEDTRDDPFAESVGDPAQARVPADADPFESFNRRIFVFNDFVDRNFLLPVAHGYRAVTPPVVDSGITNFFSNLGEFENIVNSLLQGKGESALISTGRLVFNTTFGLLGVFDVASHFELPHQDEDFGQTLGYWGVNTGPYLMLPFWGPTTPRDALGTGVDWTMPQPSDEFSRPEFYYLQGVRVVDIRADLIPAEQRITGDRYTFIRNAYLQRREYQVRDGRIENDPFANDDEDLMLEDF